MQTLLVLPPSTTRYVLEVFPLPSLPSPRLNSFSQRSFSLFSSPRVLAPHPLLLFGIPFSTEPLVFPLCL